MSVSKLKQNNNLTETFLEQYKALEQTLRHLYGNNMSVLNYEELLHPSDSNKLRVCRIIRNFLQHNPDAQDFVYPTQNMISQLLKTANHAIVENQTAKENVYKLTPLKNNSTLKQACKLITKTGRTWLPVVNQNGTFLGVLYYDKLLQLIANSENIDETTLETIKKTEWRKSISEIPIVDYLEKISAYINEQIEVIILNKEKYIGIIKWN